MAYIGKSFGGVLKEIKTVNTMTGDGSDTTLTLSDTPGSVNNVLLFIDGIKQTPATNYTVIGNALTFTTAPAAGTSVVAVVGNASGIEPKNFSVTSKHIADGTVSDSNIATGISSSKLTGAMPALDGSALTGIPASVVPLFKSASDPTITSNKPLGQIWSNSTTGEMYVCTDATVGANVWYNVGGGTGNIPFPTGGTITTDGDYKVHTFTTSGVFGIASLGKIIGNTVEYLVIAGGGGGGSDHGGGGGAGGYKTASAFNVTNGGLLVTVGAGGTGSGTSGSSDSTDGSISVFHSVTSAGGGKGGIYPAGNGNSGGSGGGGASLTGSNGTGGAANPAGQGFAGGNGANASANQRAGGGGGGAGAVGTAGLTDLTWGRGGTGGAGLASDISETGVNVFRAGGGGGGNRQPAAPGAGGDGGNGGGGKGGGLAPGTGTDNGAAGSVNLGGGGGAGANAATGGAGGSGVVIIRYRFQ